MIANTAAPESRRIAPNLTNQLPLRDVVWSAIEKIASKQKNPDEVVEGSRHTINFELQGLIDGQLFQQSIDSIVTVGHRQTRASSVTPAVPELLAWILGKLNHNTRQRILSDVPVEFAANQCSLPHCDPGLLEQVKQMLVQLRSTRTVQARGPFRCEFMLTG